MTYQESILHAVNDGPQLSLASSRCIEVELWIYGLPGGKKAHAYFTQKMFCLGSGNNHRTQLIASVQD